ncbi:PAB-dependent poly(A)-specific ribonuclease subunit 3, variant 2 [Coniochaeta pulveracea]|uniref:PAN2-PAN3 deadenylation complex subunit PAN3 n=1 Tax=Coniochaeta pulveracea TaxID=177199 RepID=A0A420XY12_9PEZI|nr:PAB-dependent poly(A)-specific ribonuclease subunit 3, variant 2 [Coniochaeta pulveracea]
MFEDTHVYYQTSKPGIGPGPHLGDYPLKSATLSNEMMSRSGKKALNVESPSFTPITLQQAAKKSTFSSQAASAAPFTPRGPSANTTPNPPQAADAPVFNPSNIREFQPQTFDISNAGSPNNQSAANDSTYSIENFGMAPIAQALPPPVPFNPYATSEHSAISSHGAAYYQPQFATPLAPPQYHLYAPIGPYREDLLPYQRVTHDFFISERLRDELQKKSHATLQTMPNSPLPQLEKYHSLFPLDTSNRKNTAIFGYPSWVFKAVSSKDGKYYCLRRLEGYRLTNEKAIHAAREWKKVINANVVTFHEAFTTRVFQDSSLIFCHDYHPLAQTLYEHHFATPQPHPRGRGLGPVAIPENVLWSYISQLSNALRAIHHAKLAARCLDMTKIIITDKNRIRLAATAILDVVQFEATQPRPVADLQQEDLVQFGKLMLALASSTPQADHVNNNIQRYMDSLPMKYSASLAEAISWLISPPAPGDKTKHIDTFISNIAMHVMNSADQALRASDSLTSELTRELENGRLVRLLCKLNTITERGEYAGEVAWSENGERYPLKLFRDYVFHQVDDQGRPVLDLGHMIRCLNKLDAAAEDRITLVTRDEQSVFVVSYKDLKLLLDRSFNELLKRTKQAQNSPGTVLVPGI